MHETISKRIFVGGLSSEVSAGEILERFSRFGKVGNLSLKTRRDESGHVIKSFAHLDLEGDEANIKKCFNTYQNTKWKGSVLQLQYAKESFLQKLEKEREEAQNQQEVVLEVKPSQTSQPQLFEIKGPAVPGTPVPGKKDWVVGKYGRVLPILKLKKSYKIKMVKYDPSKHCHAARVFKDDKTSTPADTSCNKLTWEINTPDTEITRKRKGEFPQTSTSVKKIKKSVLLPAEYFRNIQKLTPKMEEVEFVKVGSGHLNAATKLIKSNRFDSDLESDSEGNSFNQNVFGRLQTGTNNQLQGPTTGCRTMEEKNEKVKLKVNENKSKKKAVPQSTGKELIVSASVSKNGPVMLGPNMAEVAFVKVGSGQMNAATKLIKSNRFDSDLESDSEGSNFGQKVTPGPQMNVITGAETSKSSKIKQSLQKESCASTGNRISKFKGLGMLGLLEDCSKEKCEPKTNCSLSGNSSVVAMANDAGDKSTTTDKGSPDTSFGPGEMSNDSEDYESDLEDKDVEEDEESDEEEDESEGSDEEEDESEGNEEDDDESEDIDEDEEIMEDKDDDKSEDIDDDEERDTDYAEMCKPSTDVDKRLKETSGNMKVAQTVIKKTSWCPASEKFKNSTVPIIDMRAFRFDPTKIQRAVENETPPQKKVTTATLRNQTQTDDKLHKISTAEVQQNKHIVNERSVVQEDKSDTVKKAGKIDISRKPLTLPTVERLNTVHKKLVTLPAAERLNNVSKKPVTLPVSKSLDTVNKKPLTLPIARSLYSVNKTPVTLPASKKLNNINKKPVTLSAAERLNTVNKKPVTVPAVERLNTVNKKPVTVPAVERLNTVNKKPVTVPAVERLNTVNKKPVTVPAVERLNTVNKKPVTVPAAERLNNVQLKPVRGSVVKSVGSKTKIHMTSSLAGLFQKKKLDSVRHEESTPFSLLQFFDQQLDPAENEGSGRVNAGDSRDQPMETLTDVRPALLKTYTQKHKETLKSERKHGEFKRGKFLSKTGRNQNKR